MSYGERTVIEGMLAMLKPHLAVEVGRAEGGSLRRLAAYSEKVISLDVVEAAGGVADLSNVTAMTGDSHELLPRVLNGLAQDGQNVDFALVDGDHSAVGVCTDIRDLLNSSAVTHTVILAHDTLNEEVRQGMMEVDYDEYQKVAWVDFDFIPGYVAQMSERLGECWGGFGLIVIDSSGTFQSGGPRWSDDLFDQSKLVWPSAHWIRQHGEPGAAAADISLVPDRLLADARNEALVLAAEVERHRAWLRGIEGSASWRITAPLRAVKRRLRRL
jgi:hypothetical protein